ncbi:arf-GAP domain and FG repeat-containing protein 1 isoform X2 [Ischnura elegans]|uniref:arf-GAP domain and FG repeat-containing protein 1 isoform X2 n=1 Tax=Ischnura elegans TaxID=197161 RepID=UPI001ED8BF55|nr:arf-GAP domain and FG repeat-containing protein 1 isoform X2 [Ischnura elegans]
MASARKKQDEKHLKILRELVSLGGNKQCFDCHQRGPTYVNMTIGSFVCTSCSGMLRGLTPPHRVKSISMASFTPEEIELIKSRGNEYCKRIWLGLYEPSHQQEAKDEQQIKDFMVAKYEKRRYYLEPSQAAALMSSKKNGPTSPPPSSPAVSQPNPRVHAGSSHGTKPLSSLVGPGVKSIVLGHHPASSSTDNIHSASTNVNSNSSNSAWLRDFGAKDPFSMSTPSLATTGTATSSPAPQQPSFANFENNPIFSSQSMPTPSALTSMVAGSPFQGGLSGASSTGGIGGNAPPSEDRYAALKDLDSLMKSSGGAGGGSMSNIENGSSQCEWPLASSSLSPWTPPQQRNASGAYGGGGGVFGSPPTSSQLGAVGARQQGLFQGPSGMEGSAVPAANSNGAFASATPFAPSPASNPFTGGALPVDANSPWVPCAAPVAAVPSAAATLNPFQAPRTSFDGQVAWGASTLGSAQNGQQHPGVGANGSAFQANQSFYGSPGETSFMSAYSSASKGWPAMVGNPFLAGSRPQAPTHSSNPFL